GEIAGEKVTDVFKQEGVVIHEVDGGGFEEGEDVQGSIDWDRRRQLMKHHTATHLINGATKEVLGNHVWQAGTKKTVEKARLDVTHYKDPTEEELDRIQELANQWIEKDLPVEKRIMEKSGAERKYGFIIYQGGAPPGNSLRVVTIGENKDIEACGGTHVDSTSEVEEVVIVGVNKVQDGVYRLEFKAGEAAREFKQYRKNLEKELKNWIDTENYHLGDVADIFDTEIDNLPAVVSRFVDEWDSQREDIWELESLVEEGIDHTYDEKPRDPRALFNEWKKQKKDIQRLEEQIEKNLKKEFIQRDSKYIKEEIPIDDVGTLIRIAKHVTSEEEDNAVVLKGKNAVIAAQGEDSDRDLESEVERLAEVVQGSGDFVKGFKLKRGVEL
ncbi:MAG: hypothetical protein SVV03_01020, partial [Candidatus Nanohaloarchaea archaeon]|nr:hypothetical protein [Candidatus Nanohaloarchaea archaeon]